MKMQTDYVLKEKRNTTLQFFISADHACYHRHPGHQMLERFKKDLLGLSEMSVWILRLGSGIIHSGKNIKRGQLGSGFGVSM